MYWEILDPSRKKILPRLAFLKSSGFYLAGGTALALHLGHLKSIDFDFYTRENFNEMQIEQNLVRKLVPIKITQRSAGTLIGQTGPIDLSFFHYPYSLLEQPVETESLNIGSVPDIAAMKVIAISQRGLRRDFLDLYVIANQYGLEKIMEWAQKKYPQSKKWL